MYTRYGKIPTRVDENYILELVPGIGRKTARMLYGERIRLFEILDVSLDMGTYLLVLSLKATSRLDQHGHLNTNESLLGYGRAAMQEMLVIRVRELFHAKKDVPEQFKFHGFHQTLDDMGITYPRPNAEINNTIARIIRRRNFYSAHHKDGKKDYSPEKNRIRSLDLITALAYVAQVEKNLHDGTAFDPFERLLNDELEADRPLVWDEVYETLTGLKAYDEDDENCSNTPEFDSYQLKAKEEVQKIRAKVEGAINNT